MKSYLITDPDYYGCDPELFASYLRGIFENHSVDFASFRDKSGNPPEIFAPLFLQICRQFGSERTLLSGDYILAKELGFWGVHLRSDQFDLITKAKKEPLFTIVSTHTLEEAKRAQELGADAVTFSPVFASPGKGKPRGIQRLGEVCKALSIPCFALGGILETEQIRACEAAGAYGFASIRYFAKRSR
ncbi:MAG: hypothetical protein B6D59_03760 [Campylobacteraceae bacterium 4484_4]|nr:MAG: hypothetical protein B6D59_03760 [Campylobacteraceae bacterium 4484_4]